MTSLAPERSATLRRMNDLNHAIDAWLGDLARARPLPAEADEPAGSAVTDTGSLPDALRQKIAGLRVGSNA